MFTDSWLMWTAALDDKTISDIITECEYYTPQDATMGHSGERTDKTYRTSELRWVDKYDKNSKFIYDILWKHAVLANRNSFGFDITDIFDIQYTTYKAEEQGQYGPHIDTFWANPTAFDRKLSIIIQLTDPSEYEGGNFVFEPGYSQPDPIDLKKKGTILVFPSFLGHQVTPITSGVRKSLVTWVEGPKFR